MIKDNITNNVWVGVHGNGISWITVSGTPLENTGYNQFLYANHTDQGIPDTNACLVLSFHREVYTGLGPVKCDKKLESFICKKLVFES